MIAKARDQRPARSEQGRNDRSRLPCASIEIQSAADDIDLCKLTTKHIFAIFNAGRASRVL
jgi:hypothetical protein